MARKGKVDIVQIFSTWSNAQNISYAKDVVRWNPAMAIQWMEQAASRIESPIIIEEYNKAVDYINGTIDSIMSQRYYVKEDYWGNTINPNQRLEKLEATFDLETYIGLMEMREGL